MSDTYCAVWVCAEGNVNSERLGNKFGQMAVFRVLQPLVLSVKKSLRGTLCLHYQGF